MLFKFYWNMTIAAQVTIITVVFCGLYTDIFDKLSTKMDHLHDPCTVWFYFGITNGIVMIIRYFVDDLLDIFNALFVYFLIHYWHHIVQ